MDVKNKRLSDCELFRFWSAFKSPSTAHSKYFPPFKETPKGRKKKIIPPPNINNSDFDTSPESPETPRKDRSSSSKRLSLSASSASLRKQKSSTLGRSGSRRSYEEDNVFTEENEERSNKQPSIGSKLKNSYSELFETLGENEAPLK